MGVKGLDARTVRASTDDCMLLERREGRGEVCASKINNLNDF